MKSTEQTPLGWHILPRHNQPFTPPIPSKHQCATQPAVLQITTFNASYMLCPGVFHPRHTAARITSYSNRSPMPALLEAGGVQRSVDTLPTPVTTERAKWLLRTQHEITRAELAAKITSHAQRKTDRVKASHRELSGSTRAGRQRVAAIQQLGAELTHAARSGRASRRAARNSFASRDRIEVKGKLNARLSAPGLRRAPQCISSCQDPAEARLGLPPARWFACSPQPRPPFYCIPGPHPWRFFFFFEPRL
jgi:hypothetical protein